MTLLDESVLDSARTRGPDGAAEAVPICRLEELQPERGVAALVAGHQIALFRLHDDTVLALSHHDPYSGANVMARGIVGTRGEVPTVASPMYKQVFSLLTGQALDDPPVRLAVYPVQVVDGIVCVVPQPLPPQTDQ
jgi:nitrite reductase (NADH) small subunit